MERIEIRNEEEYICQYNRCKLRDALEIALDCRKFEIELYWKRANYFVLIIGAVFIGFYNVDNYIYREILAFLGYSLSFAWLCLNRGSKFWQENWEKNIEYLSSANGTPIFDLIQYGNRNQWKVMSSYPYSVSRLNQIVSIFIWLCWFVLILYTSYMSLRILGTIPDSRWWAITVIKVVYLIFIPFVITGFGKGFMGRGKIKRLNLEKSVIIDKNNL